MKKFLLVLVTVIVLLALGTVFAPARIAAKALESAFPRAALGAQRNDQGKPEIRLLSASGTLWNGSGQLLVNRHPVGALSWQVQASQLLALEAAVDWQLRGDEFSAQGTAAARGEAFDLRAVQASISEQFLRTALGTYDIAPSGDLAIERLDITDLRINERMDWPSQVTAIGKLRWSGGPVRYRLAGQSYDIVLPAMDGDVFTPDGQAEADSGWPQLRVTRSDNAALMMTGRLTPRGTAAIGITRGFTRLAGQPWPGSEPDHAVVLEVEEQLN